jgi:hypothetical protein
MCERACAHDRATPCEAIPRADRPVLVRRATEAPLPGKVTGDRPDIRAAVEVASTPAAPGFRSLSPLADGPRRGRSRADGPATHLSGSPGRSSATFGDIPDAPSLAAVERLVERAPLEQPVQPVLSAHCRGTSVQAVRSEQCSGLLLIRGSGFEPQALHQDKHQVRPAVALLNGSHVGSQSSNTSSNGARPPPSWPSCHSILAIRSAASRETSGLR